MHYRVNTYSYCGMRIPHGTTCMDKQEARTKAARVIRRRRRDGYDVVTLAKGKEWEILEPEFCVMVPDVCGILELSQSH